MAMFAIATRPLIERLSSAKADQIWFADDAAGGGKILNLRNWWDLLVRHGPSYGYDVDASKTWLLAKSDKSAEANRIFSGTGVSITTEGVLHLGLLSGPMLIG